MPCHRIGNGFLCTHAVARVYICFEARTYLMEFSDWFGPAWFTVPGDEWIYAEPGGSMGFLWDIFLEWMEGRK